MVSEPVASLAGSGMSSSSSSPAADEVVREVTPAFPFQWSGLGRRVAPFAAGAVIAEASLALPPGVHSARAALISVILLAALAAGLLLPWNRLPARAAVVVPLTYCASVAALALAAGPESGIVGIVVLVPVLWTALYHSRWESAAVVAAVVAVEFGVSSAQYSVDATIIRRVVLWAVLGTVISVAIHALRARILAGHLRSERLRSRLRAVERSEDRLRIALELQDDVVSRIFSATLTLRGVQEAGAGPATVERIDHAVGELDETVRQIRHSVFDLGEQRGETGSGD